MDRVYNPYMDRAYKMYHYVDICNIIIGFYNSVQCTTSRIIVYYCYTM